MTHRSTDGRETWRRLLEWDKQQAASERLAGHILRVEGYESVDPSHPLGGKDGLQDLVCTRESKRWIGAAYFARGQQNFKEILKKFEHDLDGAKRHGVGGLSFVTNQELTLGQRSELTQKASDCLSDIFHLERVASLLDSPRCYGLRLEFLDIEMTKEEQVAFIAERDSILEGMNNNIKLLLARDNKLKRSKTSDPLQVASPYHVLSTFQKLHECRACGEIFLIEKYSAYTSLSVLSGGLNVVKCPSCDKLQSYSAFP